MAVICQRMVILFQLSTDTIDHLEHIKYYYQVINPKV